MVLEFVDETLLFLEFLECHCDDVVVFGVGNQQVEVHNLRPSCHVPGNRIDIDFLLEPYEVLLDRLHFLFKSKVEPVLDLFFQVIILVGFLFDGDTFLEVFALELFYEVLNFVVIARALIALAGSFSFLEDGLSSECSLFLELRIIHLVLSLSLIAHRSLYHFLELFVFSEVPFQ